MSLFPKHYHPPGTPPGTLSEKDLPYTSELKISLIDFSQTNFIEKELASTKECQLFLHQPTTTWIHVRGQPTPTILQELAQLFELHSLALEDILNTGQRPKSEIYDAQLFIITSLPVLQDNNFVGEQISIFAGENYIISFHMGKTDPFEPIRKRLRNPKSKARTHGASYLLYCLLDVIIDEGFPVLEKLGEQITSLEDELLSKPDKDTLRKLHMIKRELLLLRHIFWPQREMVNKLVRDENEILTNETMVYIRDCYDHSVQILELLEAYRDITASMLDVYLSSISYRLNDVMRVLTVIATIFIPLTFIVGVYGMNFNNNSNSPWAMPELSWYYGYPALWIFMLLIAALMICFFKFKGWF